MLPSMRCCAPPIFGFSPLFNFGVVSPEILKFYIDYYQFCGTPDLTPITPRVFKLHRNVAHSLFKVFSYLPLIYVELISLFK